LANHQLTLVSITGISNVSSSTDGHVDIVTTDALKPFQIVSPLVSLVTKCPSTATIQSIGYLRLSIGLYWKASLASLTPLAFLIVGIGYLKPSLSNVNLSIVSPSGSNRSPNVPGLVFINFYEQQQE
jgi:hypothetical protein